MTDNITQQNPQSISGVLVLDKPAGITSARALDTVKRLLPRGTKVGHAGTLDPFATGVLLVLVGKATKLCESLMDRPKKYEATIKLGATTETDDPESPEQPRTGAIQHHPAVNADDLAAALSRFVGAIEQRPPAFSALKINGRRACDRVRDGEAVKLKPRTVQVYSIALLDFAWPLAQVRIECGRGTYIRAIARDLGELLGVGGYLTHLRRTRIGDFGIEGSLRPDQLTRELIPVSLHMK